MSKYAAIKEWRSFVPEGPVARPDALLTNVLADLCGQGVTFNEASLNCLRHLKDEAAQIAILHRVHDLFRNPSALLMQVLQESETSGLPPSQYLMHVRSISIAGLRLL